jgi:hypothetical protein
VAFGLKGTFEPQWQFCDNSNRGHGQGANAEKGAHGEEGQEEPYTIDMSANTCQKHKSRAPQHALYMSAAGGGGSRVGTVHVGLSNSFRNKVEPPGPDTDGPDRQGLKNFWTHTTCTVTGPGCCVGFA